MTSAPHCRFCGTPLTHTLVDLGLQPLANSYLTAEQLTAKSERAYPLHARVCHACFLVQVDDVVPADAIFDEAMPISRPTRQLGRACAPLRRGDDRALRPGAGVAGRRGREQRRLSASALRGHGIPVLGIEPAANAAEAAIARGMPTEVIFFSDRTGAALAAPRRARRPDGGEQRARACAGHRRLRRGLPRPPEGRGRAHLRVPAPTEPDREVQFDTIYHEHFSYLSLLAVEQVLRANGLGRSTSSYCRPTAVRCGCSLPRRLRPRRDRRARRLCAPWRRPRGWLGSRPMTASRRGSRPFATASAPSLRARRPRDASCRGLWRGGQGQHVPELLRRDGGRHRLRFRREPRQAGPLPARQPRADPPPGAVAEMRAGLPSDPALEPERRDHEPDGLHPGLGRPFRHRLAGDEGPRLMRFTETDIDGVVVVDVDPHADDRGSFARLHCPDEFAEAGHPFTPGADQPVAQPARGYAARNALSARAAGRGEAGPLRPWSDLRRRRRPAPGKPDPSALDRLRSFSAENARALFIPEGVAHGFLTLAPDSDVLYQISASPRAGSRGGRALERSGVRRRVAGRARPDLGA